MKWLHLSDLHYNPKRDGTSTYQLREKLLKYLAEEKITADHLFLTGDYRHAKYQKDDEEDAAREAAQYILRIAEAAKVYPANIHVIPGNHDLSRTMDTNRIKRIKENYDACNGRFQQEDAEFLLERFSFFRYLNRELGKHGMKSPWSDSMFPLHTYRCFDEFSLLFLNSSILCNSDYDRGELIIGNFDLYQALEKIKEENSDKPIIILAHHGLDNYREDERKVVEKLFEEYPVRMYLCGDAHMPWKRRTNEVLEITMGCLMQDKNVRTVFSVGEWKVGTYSIEAHEWDANENEWGEYTQFNKKLRQWSLRKYSDNPLQIENITKEQPAAPAAYFRGRNAKIAEIEELLWHKERIVLLYGIGGIGKTEICRQLYRNCAIKSDTNPINKIGWITYCGTLKDSFYEQFPEIPDDNIENYWIKVQLLIRRLREALLLIIDNANEITSQEIALLDKLGCRVILTSRRKAERITNVEITGLGLEDCRLLYRLHSMDEISGDDVIDRIISLAMRHSLTVELLAKTQCAAGISAEELLHILLDKGFDLSEITESVTYFHNAEQEDESTQSKRFIEHMAKIFDISEVKEIPEELEILQLFSLLAPGTPIPFKIVKKWLELEDLNDINSVIRKGWLSRCDLETAPSVVIHPVISAVIRYAVMPDEELTGILMSNVTDDLQLQEGESFTEKQNIMLHAEAIVRTICVSTGEKANMMERMACIYSDRGEYEKALENYMSALKIYEEVFGKDYSGSDVIYNNIACVYFGQEKYQEALKWYERALRVLEEASEKEKLKTDSTYYVNVASVYSGLSEYERALEWYEKARKIQVEALGEDHADMADIYNGIAGVYNAHVR